ncbi:AsmA family protein [Arenibacterium sp. CAU 1754]
MRWIFRIIGALIVAAVLLVGVVLMLPGEKIAKLAADQLRAQTGREVSFQGDVTFSLWPVLGVETGPVTVANADWAGPEPMLRAQSLSIGVSAPDLVRGAIRVKRVVAEAPELNLQRRADGRVNWAFETPAAPSAGTGQGTAAKSRREMTLEQMRLKNARLTYLAEGESPVTFAGVDVDLDWPDPAGAADLRIAMAPNGQAVSVAAQIASFAAFIDGAVSPLTARIKAPGSTVDFVGRAASTGESAGRVTIKTTDTARLLSALGAGAVDIPSGAGRSADISGDVTYTTDGRVSLRDMLIGLDQNRLSGAADVTLGDRPMITARLSADALDFSALGDGPTQTGGAGTSSGETGWSRVPIDASALRLVDGTISLTAKSIKTSTTQLGDTNAVLQIDRSRAVLELARVTAFGGTLTGQLVANNRKGLSVGGKLRASDIEMKSALTDLAEVKRLSGKATVEFEFLGVGQSVDAIMKSLSGKGSLKMAQGVISGIDLNALMRSGEGGGTTVFDSLTATHVITNGNLMNEDLLLLLPNYRADGVGRIGLGARDIDYLFTPVATRANAGQGLAVPVRIKGPWSNPSIRPDLEGVMKARADEKIKALEEETKAKAKEKLIKELDVQVPEGQSAEEAIKDKLEDEAKKGLLKLLGKD